MFEKLPDALGHALRDVRAGLDQIAFNQSGLRAGMGQLQVTSLAFADHAPIPERYTADGAGRSPPLSWSCVPPAADGSLAEGAINDDHDDEGDADAVHEGRNSFLMAGWLPPDPPPGHGVHRYAFQLFALGPGERFEGTPGRDELLEAVRQRGLASGCLFGTYERPDTSIKIGDARPVTA
jgi:phosphatidylethanolamine-binding protein (PEBP) family uncharacterized protein